MPKWLKRFGIWLAGIGLFIAAIFIAARDKMPKITKKKTREEKDPLPQDIQDEIDQSRDDLSRLP